MTTRHIHANFIAKLERERIAIAHQRTAELVYARLMMVCGVRVLK